MTKSQKIQKRIFDITLSFIGLVLTGWLILLAAGIARLDTGLNGFFRQKRVGKNGKIFKVAKIRSMKPVKGVTTSVTAKNDPRISKVGRFWRKTKIDELPQLWNVLVGDMSFVGPRPDVPGFADKLKGEDRIILTVRPGITGTATLKYRNEEELLGMQSDAELYNTQVIWPDKVRINKHYINNYSIWLDIKILIRTIFGT